MDEIKLEMVHPPPIEIIITNTLPCGAHQEIIGPGDKYELKRICDKPCEWIYCKINSDEWKESEKWTWIVNRMLELGWEFKKGIPAEKYYNKALAEYTIRMCSTYWPWNETFEHYYETPLVGKEAFDFIERRNECKDGHWVLHTKEQYDQWYKEKGEFLEWATDPMGAMKRQARMKIDNEMKMRF
jgi:hypothetical protein